VSDPTFLYLDYGPSPYFGRELRYSLATLLAEYDARPMRALVYTDKPDRYAGLHSRLAARDIRGDLAAWTLGGAYAHRLKPCALRDALTREGGQCVLLDTDSYVEPGFAEALARATTDGPAMDYFEGRDPYPEIAGFAADLPSGRRYAYDPRTAIMCNSGLIAADASRDLSAIDDAVGLIDALWRAGRRLFKIEQIAVSEAFRLHGATIGETRPAFQHYCRRSLKRYMRWRIDRWIAGDPGFAPTRPFIRPSRNAVRVFNYVNRLIGRY
jgi:hypothetical protein